MTMIRYIGPKASKEDNVAHTGIVWLHGTAQDVPEKAVPKLLLHPAVWALDRPTDEVPAESTLTMSDAQLDEQIAAMTEHSEVVEIVGPEKQKRPEHKKAKG